MRKISVLIPVLLLVCITLFAQNRTVSGRVTDAQGKPVPFASVTVRGAGKGVAADENGNFTIQIPPGAVLVISASGYQNVTVNTGTETTVSAVLTSQSALSE